MALHPRKGWLLSPLSHKGEKNELGFKNRQLNFSDEVENTQSAKKQKLNPPDGTPTDVFCTQLMTGYQ